MIKLVRIFVFKLLTQLECSLMWDTLFCVTNLVKSCINLVYVDLIFKLINNTLLFVGIILQVC